jgi:rhodanese-related sulfurtransferase
MIHKHDAILATYPTVINIRGDVAYDKDENIVAYNESIVQAYIDANTYKEQRARAYPSFADQFDLLYHGGYDAWKAAIDAVKQEYPKP